MRGLTKAALLLAPALASAALTSDDQGERIQSLGFSILT
jgi:hypothetical protein